MKKILTILLCLTLLISMTACSGKDMTQGKAPEEILEEAITKAAEWENYEMALETHMIMDIPPQGEIEMNMTGVGVAFIKPLKMHMTMSMHMPQMEESQNIEQYIVQEEETFSIYQNYEGQWYKNVMEGEGIEELMSVDPMESIQLFVKHIKSAEIVEEEKINDKDAVRIDVTVSFDMYKELMETNGSLDMSAMFGMDVFEMLGSMGDLTYSIWVEKESLNVVKYHMNLSEAMNKMAEAMQEIEEVPQELIDVYQTSQMEMSVTLSNQNNVEDFEIPEEALNAEEIPFIN
ncbi:MAG: hypothetical protein MJA31_02565 [Clostridia bacterium]|nr:hypothetical protein [Clostridia bacterium]